jgi:hypothetical protein
MLAHLLFGSVGLALIWHLQLAPLVIGRPGQGEPGQGAPDRDRSAPDPLGLASDPE